MSSAPREEGGRARRRRRRGASLRADVDHANPQSNPRHTANQQQLTSETHRPQTPQSTSERPPPTSSEVNAEQVRLTEEAHRASVEADRLAKAAELLAKRGDERSLNLSYVLVGPDDTPPSARLSDAELRQLDSSLKKCNGFLRKIKFSGLTEESAPSLCSEANSLNLSRYISEVVTAIAESKLKSSDTDHLVSLCVQLHRRYEEFASQLASALRQVITASPGRELSARKGAMRLQVELFILGVCVDVNSVTSVLRDVMRGSKESKEEQLNSLSVIGTFIRAGARCFLPHTGNQSESRDDEQPTVSVSTWEDEILPQSSKVNIESALTTYYENEVVRFVNEAADQLNASTLAANDLRQARGSPDDAKSSAYESAKVFYEKAVSSATTLAEALGKTAFFPSAAQLIMSSQDVSAVHDPSQVMVSNPMTLAVKARAANVETDAALFGTHPFDSEEEQSFYCDLPTLADLKKTEEQDSDPVGKLKSGMKDASGANKTAHGSSDSRARMDSKHSSNAKQSNDGRRRGADKVASLDSIIGRLSQVETKESANNFVHQFVPAIDGSRSGCRRLANVLFSVSPQKLNLLPAYSRVAASLYPLYRDVADSVASSLEEEFRFLVGKRDIDEKSLAACIKVAQYIGEYVKFGLIGTSTMFDLLAFCMKDFGGHRVDAACHLLESCGRFVYRTPTTHIRMSTTLDTLWRLKSVKNLEARHNALVETAFFAARPSASSRIQKRKDRPPVHEYVRHLIYFRLSSANIRWTQTQLLKLPWDDDLENYVAKKFVKISRARFSTIPYVSSLLGSLQKHKSGLVITVVDSLVESIRAGLEKNDGRDSQRRIAEVHLLGELYKCGVVDERLIYNVLYDSITLGYSGSELSAAGMGLVSGTLSSTGDSEQAENDYQSSKGTNGTNGTFTSAPDPPGDFFRVRIACVIIESCGRILAASNRRKLEVFWIILDRYIYCKTFQAGLGNRLPLHINHVVGDAFEHALQKPRRLFKDDRFGSDGEMRISVTESVYPGSRREHQRHTPIQSMLAKPFSRSRSLEEALEAVEQIESSAADVALICLPVRQVPPVSDDPSKAEIQPPTERPVGYSTPERDSIEHMKNNGRNQGDDRFSEEYAEEDEEDRVDDSSCSDDLVSNDYVSESDDDNDGVDSENYHSSGAGEDSDDVDEDDEDEDDDEDVILSMPRQRRTEEEDAFAKELAAYTAAAVQSARASSSRVTTFDRMAIPMSLMTKKQDSGNIRTAFGTRSTPGDSESSGERDGESRTTRRRISQMQSVEFKMLFRRGGKSHMHELHVPASSSLAVAAKESETADAARLEETKRLVLQSNTVLNDEADDLDDEVPIQAEQNARAKEESIRQQRDADQKELLATLFKPKPRR